MGILMMVHGLQKIVNQAKRCYNQLIYGLLKLVDRRGNLGCRIRTSSWGWRWGKRGISAATGRM
jgi:hypothetical protein